jgi:ketosteroid isomerase-like protein
MLFCCAAVGQALAQAAGPAPATAAGQASSPAPGVLTTTSPEVAQFQKIEDAWSSAVNQRDQYGLENVISPLFVDVAANGDISTRNQQVVQLINGEDKTANLTQKVVTVRMLGDIAVVNGTYLLHHKVGGSPVDEKGVFTHVFEKVRAGWMCINSQRTLLHEGASGPASKTAKKNPSSAESPFHIPLFSK